MRTALLFFSVFLMTCYLQAQTKEQGTLRVFTQPKDAIIYLDTLKLQYNTPIIIDTGKHTIKAWAPERELVEKEFYIKKGMYRSLPVKLPYSKEYKKYRWDMRLYSIKKQSLKYGILAAYLYVAITKYSETNSEIKSLEKQSDFHMSEALKYKSRYETSFWQTDIEINREGFNSNKEAHEDKVNQINEHRKTIRNLQIGLGGVGVLTYFTWKLAAKIKKPTYSETPKLSRLQFTPVVTPMTTSFQLNYQF